MWAMKAKQDTKLWEADGCSILCCHQADIRNSSMKQVNVSPGTVNTFSQKAAGFLSLSGHGVWTYVQIVIFANSQVASWMEVIIVRMCVSASVTKSECPMCWGENTDLPPDLKGGASMSAICCGQWQGQYWRWNSGKVFWRGKFLTSSLDFSKHWSLWYWVQSPFAW